MKSLKRVVIMAGGTGGHVFPGLALANYLRSQQVDVHWLGTSQGLEARLVPENHFPLHEINITGLRGKNLKTLLTAPYKISIAILQARRILKKINPDIVIGMGGFASGPGGIAARLLGIPLIIHEQNAKIGFTNKVLGHFSHKILTGFPDIFAVSTKQMTVGNPVRPEIEALSPLELDATHPLHLLILGGSLGAEALNQLLPKALAHLPFNERPEVRHQAGEKHWANTQKYYEASQVAATVVPFMKEMAEAYAWADLVICRAGALTVAELCAAGRGAILIPFPFAVDDHQTANAQFMAKQGAALCLQQRELTEEQLADHIRAFVEEREKGVSMAKAAYQLRKTRVPEQIFAILSDIIN